MHNLNNKIEKKLSDLNNKISKLQIENNVLKDKLYTDSNVQLLNKILSISNEAILILNKEGKILECNQKFLQLTGLVKADESDQLFLQDFISEDDKEVYFKCVENSFNEDTTEKLETYLKTETGQLFPGILTISVLQKKSEFLIAIIHDLSRRMELETNALRQIEVYAKQSIVNNELRQVASLKELKNSLCSQTLLLTECVETWFLSSNYNSHTELLVYDRTSHHNHKIKIKPDSLENQLIFIKNKKDIYTFKNKEIIRFPFFKQVSNIKQQYILANRLRSGALYIIGLNYHTEIEHNGDMDFLRSIFSIIFAAIESLTSYEQLIESESRFRALTEKINAVVFIVDRNNKYAYVSPSIKNYDLYVEDIIGKEPGFLTYPEDKQLMIEAVKKVTLVKGSSIELPQIRIVLKNDSIYYFIVSITNLYDYPGIDGLVINFWEINKHVEYENKLKQSEENFRNIFNYSSDSVFITDPQGNFLEVNNTAIERVGFSKEEFIKMNVRDILPHISNDRINNFLSDVVKDGTAATEDSYTNKSGDEVDFEISGRSIIYMEKHAFLFRSIDITSRKRAERQIMDAIVRTEEKERSRIARDLHDGIGPYLSAIKFYLKTLSRETNKYEQNKISNKAIDSIDEVIRNVKDISNNISPRIMKHFGIISAIDSFVKKAVNLKIPVSINSNIEGIRFNENLEIAIFRIVTELINNTIKHSNATKIDLNIYQKNKQLDIVFEHNGKGFNFKKIIEQGKGDGLFNIIHRVKSQNGVCEFDTNEKKSLTFKAQFNLK